MKTMLMTAIRKAGEPDFEFTIQGYPGNQFPPFAMQASMREMTMWLRQMPRRRLASIAGDNSDSETPSR